MPSVGMTEVCLWNSCHRAVARIQASNRRVEFSVWRCWQPQPASSPGGSQLRSRQWYRLWWRGDRTVRPLRSAVDEPPGPLRVALCAAHQQWHGGAGLLRRVAAAWALVRIDALVVDGSRLDGVGGHRAQWGAGIGTTAAWGWQCRCGRGSREPRGRGELLVSTILWGGWRPVRRLARGRLAL